MGRSSATERPNFPVSSGPWASAREQARPAVIKSRNSETSVLWGGQTIRLSYFWHGVGLDAAKLGPASECHLCISNGIMGLVPHP